MGQEKKGVGGMEGRDNEWENGGGLQKLGENSFSDRAHKTSGTLILAQWNSFPEQ